MDNDLGSAALELHSAGPPRRFDGAPQAPLVYVPEGAGEAPRGLALLFHGSGCGPEQMVEIARPHADRLGFMILAPKSVMPSWDVIVTGRYGADVAAAGAALEQAAGARDPRRMAIGGFSDGASYALSVGLSNGDLFGHILAFSPGFAWPTRRRGSPRVLIAHGDADPVLPAAECGRRVVAELRRSGQDPLYREFSGGHEVPEPVARWAFDAAFAAPPP